MGAPRITSEIIEGRSYHATISWWLFKILVPFLLPKPILQKGPQIFPQLPPIPSNCRAEQWEYEDWNMSVIKPASVNTKLLRVVMYWHGGAFAHPVNRSHWRLCSTLALELEAEVIMVPYPLAPENRANEVLAQLDRLYTALLQRADGREVILAGDSSGANLALSVSLSAAAENLPLPKQLLLISPWLDLACDNPSVAEFRRNDPILSLNRLRAKGIQWLMGPLPFDPSQLETELKNPRFSPIYATLRPLALSKTHVVLVSGTFDVLHADITLFLTNAEREGVHLHYIEGRGQVHTFPLYSQVIPEGEMAVQKMIAALQKHSTG